MSLWKAKKGNNLTDKVMTNPEVAKHMVDVLREFFRDGESFLEPCMWDGGIYNFLPEKKDWCEIDRGRDFYDYHGKVDWIITNPPYSDYDKFVEHCMECADNIALLIPLAKPFSSLQRIKKMVWYGNIHSLFIFNHGASKAWFPFWFPLSIYYFKRWYEWETQIKFI